MSYQVHVDGMSCHKFGPIHQAVCPSHLNHLTLRWGSKLSTVSTLTDKIHIAEQYSESSEKTEEKNTFYAP